MTRMTRDQEYRVRQLRSDIEARLQRMDGLTGGSVVSACQHRTARQMEIENRRDQAKIDEIEGREPQPLIEPSRALTEADRTRLETLIARWAQRGQPDHEEVLIARLVLANEAGMATLREARLLGIGR